MAKPAGADDPRTAGQRYADALHASLSNRQQSHMTVIVNLDTLTGGAEPGRLPDGSPLPAADARRIARNAALTPELTTGDGLPLDVGRERRLANTAQRQALTIRDGGCVVDGCTIPAAWCEVDHVTPWALGGRTDLANLALCCSFHNKYKNRQPDRVHITRHDDGRITYRITRHATYSRRHARPRSRTEDGQPRDGPDTRAA